MKLCMHLLTPICLQVDADVDDSDSVLVVEEELQSDGMWPGPMLMLYRKCLGGNLK